MVQKLNEKNGDNSVLYGLFAGAGLILFYLMVISFFQGIEFAFLNLRSLWYFIFPLAIGFGTAGSMIACCSHFLVNLIPIIGLSGVAVFLVQYEKIIPHPKGCGF